MDGQARQLAVHPRWWHRFHPHTGRGISSVAAVAAGAGLIWFLFFRAAWNPALGAASEIFWVRTLTAMAFYMFIQQVTLAYETGRGDEVAATIDLFVALVPFAVVILCEVYWFGKESPLYLSWRHHIVGGIYAIYSIGDFFATSVTNQRLRALQFSPPRKD